jgi:hypothetical protein
MFRTALVVVLLVGCSRTTPIPKSPSIAKRYKEVTELPKYQVKKTWAKRTIQSLKKGDPALFDGIIFIEKRALEAGRLRIAYDELYKIAEINRRFVNVVIKVSDDALRKADAKVRRLRALRNSWWSRNKLSIGLVGGFVIGIGVTGLIVYGVSKAIK